MKKKKEIIEINRQRMQQDFKVKADRFTSFAENNIEFAKKEPWNNLLKLGDMNAFTTMTPEEREKFKTEFAARCRHRWGGSWGNPEPNAEKGL